ncbi:UNVERIFIED_CONTAM: Alkylated DNA repair protein ALK [Sesamum angustifolium]|uniref:Alkylated DNA repair protein ALK n=1 Tax=Sesamum angustifolium TaxID=2727405 RepID=A0AAW2MI29_9LAMI
MGLPRFTCPKGGDGESSPHLYVANCGPAVGLSYDTIASVFGTYGEVKGVCAADESGTRVIVSYHDKSSAQAAMKALNRHPCSSLGGRFLHIQYSVQSLGKVNNIDSVPVSTSASDLDIPGLYLMHDFVTAQEEQELLAAVDDRPWQHLAKRRVQHYGYEFRYDIRNVNTNHYLGELPSFVSPILERIRSFQTLDHAVDVSLDQLTVNEYPPGVGLSPHIDTHSAFEDLIFSLSLAGPCIMEFRKYATVEWQEKTTSSSDKGEQISEKNSSFVRKVIYLPPLSMLLLSGEARYVWHHYIPHHKVDKVNDSLIRRGSRRVSFTLRKILVHCTVDKNGVASTKYVAVRTTLVLPGKQFRPSTGILLELGDCSTLFYFESAPGK